MGQVVVFTFPFFFLRRCLGRSTEAARAGSFEGSDLLVKGLAAGSPTEGLRTGPMSSLVLASIFKDISGRTVPRGCRFKPAGEVWEAGSGRRLPAEDGFCVPDVEGTGTGRLIPAQEELVIGGPWVPDVEGTGSGRLLPAEEGELVVGGPSASDGEGA